MGTPADLTLDEERRVYEFSARVIDVVRFDTGTPRGELADVEMRTGDSDWLVLAMAQTIMELRRRLAAEINREANPILGNDE